MLIDPKNLIVCQKHKQSANQKFFGIFLHVLFWGVVLYVLFSFLVIFCGYLIEHNWFNHALIGYKDVHAINAIIVKFFPMIGIAVSALFLWAFYNKIRFHGKRDRRKNHPPPLSMDEIVSTSLLDAADIQNMRQAKIMTCVFDNEGNIIGVKHDVSMTAENTAPIVSKTFLREKAGV